MYMGFVGGCPSTFLVMRYWHPYKLRRPMREVADFYPKTYKKVGETLASLGYDVDPDSNYRHTTDELRSMFLAIISAMPPHVKPYRSMGCEKTWAECDWGYLLSSLTQEAA